MNARFADIASTIQLQSYAVFHYKYLIIDA